MLANRRITFLTIIVLLASCLTAYKEVEKCILETLKSSDSEYLYLTDIRLLTAAFLDSILMPKELVVSLKKCGVVEYLQRQQQDRKARQDYELCGLVSVPACPKGYIRVDCGICAEACPEGTITRSAGLLCLKPNIEKKEIYYNLSECHSKHGECQTYDKTSLPPSLEEGDHHHKIYVTSICRNLYKDLGHFLCTYQCPDTFTDSGDYCVPRRIENFQYALNSFAGKMDLKQE